MRIGLTSTLLSCVLLLPAQGLTQTSKFSTTAGFEAAIKLLGSVKDAYQTALVDPAARAQARRSLRRLANRLEGLSLAKEDFTAEVLAGASIGVVQRRLNELQEQVRQVRASLSAAFEPLPDDWRKRAGDVQRGIEQPLNDKATTLRDIAEQLRLPQASREQLQQESETTIELVAKMRTLVDQLIDDLTRPRH